MRQRKAWVAIAVILLVLGPSIGFPTHITGSYSMSFPRSAAGILAQSNPFDQGIHKVHKFIIPRLGKNLQNDPFETSLNGNRHKHPTMGFCPYHGFDQVCPPLLPARGPFSPSTTPALAPEVGTLLANVTSNISFPYAEAYNPFNGYVYVANEGSDTVIAMLGTKVVSVTAVGSYPSAIAINSLNGLVYVSNSNDDNVSVLNGTRVVQTLTTGVDPQALYFAPKTGYLYISNYGSDSVTIYNGTTQIGDLAVGSDPGSFTYDTLNGFLYVPNYGGSNVSVINGTKVVASVQVLGGVGGAGPSGLCFDPHNGFVYVPNGFSDSVSVVNGTRSIANLTGFFLPTMAAYDPVNQLIYVVNNQVNTVSVIQGTQVLRSISVGSGPLEVAYIPGNGLMYVSNTYSSDVSVLNSTKIRGVLNVAPYPMDTIYDPRSAEAYVLCQNSADVISTALGLAVVVATPSGQPTNTSDIGRSVEFNTTLWAIGTSHDNVTWGSSPAIGMGCIPGVNFTSPNATAQYGLLKISCEPTAQGNYTVWLNASDSSGANVSSSISFTVFQDPLGTPLHPSPLGANVTASWADMGQLVNLTELPQGGSGEFGGWNWEGLPTGQCVGIATSEVHCDFQHVGTYAISASFNDSNGMNATTPTLPYDAFAGLVVAAPVATRTNLDVQESFILTVNASGGGPGGYLYQWGGLPQGCVGTSLNPLECTPTMAGNYSIRASASDSAGATVTSVPLKIKVSSLPEADMITATRISADVGQTVGLRSAVTGGSGGLNYSWQGFAGSTCTGLTGPSPNCTMMTPGILTVIFSVTDSNGGVSGPSPVQTIHVYPDPVVAAPVLTAPKVAEGTTIDISLNIMGGSGSFNISWIGLPAGCTLSGFMATCFPRIAGTYNISVEVSDSNGFTVRSASTMLTVIVPSITTPGSTIFGLSATTFYGMVVVIATLTGSSIYMTYRLRRIRRQGGPKG